MPHLRGKGKGVPDPETGGEGIFRRCLCAGPQCGYSFGGPQTLPSLVESAVNERILPRGADKTMSAELVSALSDE